MSSAASRTPRGRKGLSCTRSPDQVRRDFVKLWLSSAENDLLAAKAILAAPMPSWETASFHAQQAAEKSLKALLVSHQVYFGKTHNIGELLLLAEVVAPGIAAQLSETRALTHYAVDARYPGEALPLDLESARRHLTLAVSVVDAVKKVLR